MKIDQELLYKELDQFLSNYTGTDIIYVKKIAPILGVSYITLMYYLKKDKFQPLLDKIYDINTKNAEHSNSPVRAIKASKNMNVKTEPITLRDKTIAMIKHRFELNKHLKICNLPKLLDVNKNTFFKFIYKKENDDLRKKIRENNLELKNNKRYKPINEIKFPGEGTKCYILHNGFYEWRINDRTEMLRMMKAKCKRGLMTDYEKKMTNLIFKQKRFELYLPYIDKIIKESKEQWKILGY